MKLKDKLELFDTWLRRRDWLNLPNAVPIVAILLVIMIRLLIYVL